MTSVFAKVIKKMKKGFQKLESCEKAQPDEGDKVLPFTSTQLTPALIEEARKKLNETDEVKEKALAEFRKLIASQWIATFLKDIQIPTHSHIQTSVRNVHVCRG